MLKVKEIKVIEAFTVKELERYVNVYISENKNLNVMDIKFNVYETDIEPEFLDLETDGKTRENRFTALILIGQEI